MKKLITLFFLFGTLASSAQFSETFSDGDFTANPAWTGDAGLFEVNPSGQLHLLASAADTAFLSTSCTGLSDTEWRFWMKMSFNTSANNHARIYLVSDNEDLEGPLNGYFIQAGGTNDSVVFYRQDGTMSVRLTGCALLFTGHSTNMFRFRITLDNGGNWMISSDTTGGTNYFTVGSVLDSTYVLSSGFLGVWCRFTSSNGSKFYFDDFYQGAVVNDTIPPAIKRISISGADGINLYFSEAPDMQTACDTARYMIVGTGTHPMSAVPALQDPSCIVLGFSGSFPEPWCDSIRVTGINDPSGNTLSDTSVAVCHFHPRPNDIVINEILSDPYPSGSRFIELYNRSSMPADLQEFVLNYLSDDSLTIKSVEVTEKSDYILPLDYAVLCADCNDVSCRYNSTGSGKFLDVASFPALSATGGTVMIIRAGDSVVIDKVVYSEDMHNPLLSSSEGVSLERVSPDLSSQEPSNWHSAAASAGYATPGIRNSQWWSPGQEQSGEVTLDPQIFSPDGDATNDLLHIICKPGGPDFMATVVVYDSRGRRVRYLAGNELIATEAVFAWDGVTEERTRAPAGIYVVLVELVRTDGTVKRYKRPATVAVKF